MWIDDQVIKKCGQSLAIECWIPENRMVVLGRSNKEETEVFGERCREDSIPVLKRYGGGGTVLLGPGCVVASIGAWVSNPYDNDKYFDLLNSALIECFNSHFQKKDFGQRGYSDIVYGPKKFVGTSLFRSRKYLLYQASILVDLDLEDINLYLRHPSKEPDYRKGRSHSDFLVGLSDLDSSYSVEKCLGGLQKGLEGALMKRLSDQLVEPQMEHIPHLMKRAGIEVL